MEEKRRESASRLSSHLGSAQSRGLLILLGAALLIAGLAECLPIDRRRRDPPLLEFAYEDVEVIVPVFASETCIDVNAAPMEDLMRLHGVGEALASRIIVHREAHGPFAAIDELDDVPGIGPATIDGFRDRACVGSGDQ
jgi:competence ComEA-like helix-hairpin-helix protein